MELHLLPARTGNAAENMALDSLLLQRYPDEAIRFRHYSWHHPAISFGYSQKWQNVRQPSPDFEYVRRPTGGGIVDHTHDWTYSLGIPRAHPLYQQPASATYCQIHTTIAQLLQARDIPAALQPSKTGKQTLASSCFQKAEPSDVVLLPGGQKIAGAALKRSKHGLLLQGSIARSPFPSSFDWSSLENDFATRLATATSTELTEKTCPDFDPDEELSLLEQFSSPEWNERR